MRWHRMPGRTWTWRDPSTHRFRWRQLHGLCNFAVLRYSGARYFDDNGQTGLATLDWTWCVILSSNPFTRRAH